MMRIRSKIGSIIVLCMKWDFFLLSDRWHVPALVEARRRRPISNDIEQCIDDEDGAADCHKRFLNAAADKYVESPVVFSSPKTFPQSLEGFNQMKEVESHWRSHNCRGVFENGKSAFQQECCFIFDDDGNAEKYACLPKFIVAGTIKSGTTAFAGMLLQHPQIQMSTWAKEVHYFDNRGINARGLPWYLGTFNESQLGSEDRFINGEVCGSYFHSQDACYLISKELPGARLAALVRDPVARAYSEWQMLQRRAAAQAGFLGQLQERAAELYRCAALAPPGRHRPAEVAACVGPPLVDSVGWLRLWLHRAPPRQAPAAAAAAARACFILGGRPLRPGELSSLESFEQWKNIPVSQTETLSFDENNADCFENYERLRSWEDVVEQETAEISRCVSGINLAPGKHKPSDLVKALDSCIHIKTQGVTSHHLHKSIYIWHYIRCSRFIPQEQILLIDSLELENDPAQVMKKMEGFLGLDPAENYVFDTESLEARVETEYPLTFTNSSREYNGFQMRGAYAPMDPAVRARLDTFFAPYNRLLAAVAPGLSFVGGDNSGDSGGEERAPATPASGQRRRRRRRQGGSMETVGANDEL